MTKPTIHLNGTSAKDLSSGYAEAYAAINQAVDKLQNTSPNGRDYYPQGNEAFAKAHEEHMGRVMEMSAVSDAIWELMLHCEGLSI